MGKGAGPNSAKRQAAIARKNGNPLPNARSRFSTWKPPVTQPKRNKKVEERITQRAEKKKESAIKVDNATAQEVRAARAMLRGIDIASLEEVVLTREGRQAAEDLIAARILPQVKDDEPQVESKSSKQREPAIKIKENTLSPPAEIRNDAESLRVWAYLTRRLSFSAHDTNRAILASKQLHNEVVTLSTSLDWLCLHLSDSQLELGFKRKNGLTDKNKSQRLVVVKDSAGLALAGAFDYAAESTITSLQARLGITVTEARQAVDQSPPGDEHRALCFALGALSDCDSSKHDFDEDKALEAKAEREAEAEALEAIFGSDKVVREKETGLTLCLEDSLQVSVLYHEHTSYPISGLPVLFVEKERLPPSCLRELNAKLNSFGCTQLAGRPALFEAADWLREHFSKIYDAFRAQAARQEADRVIKQEVFIDQEKQKEHDAYLLTMAEEAARTAFLREMNQTEDLAAARAAADLARNEVLSGDDPLPPIENEENTDDQAEEDNQALAKIVETQKNDEIEAVIEATGASREVARSLIAQSKRSKNVVAEAIRLNGLRSLTTNTSPVTTPQQLDQMQFSPLLREMALLVRETRSEQPWLATTPVKESAPLSSRLVDEQQTPEKPAEETSKQLAESAKLKSALEEKRNINTAYKEMLRTRKSLPAYNTKSIVVEACTKHRVVVIAGDTGSGKTTQVPQLVLDDAIDNGHGANCSIIVTQPRRISAVGVARRVAEERAESIGQTVGYSIRGETRRSSETRLLFCTTGVLLRRLQVDPTLDTVSHCFIDEVHERDINADFLLIILRQLLKKAPRLRIVLMSATVDARLFADYFKAFHPAIVNIPGRTHPVEARYLEDALAMTNLVVDPRSDCAVGNQRKSKFEQPPFWLGMTKRDWAAKLPEYPETVHSALSILDPSAVNYDLIVALCETIHTGTILPPSATDDKSTAAAILVFLPGLMEIASLVERLEASETLKHGCKIHALHSALSPSEQSAVFRRPPAGIRKIVCATNIAETSITIDDVVFCIDCCRVKENRYDPTRGMSTLEEVFVSKASARQRRGRAGRVKPGICYHLVTKKHHDQGLEPYAQPEMLRTSLDQLVLQILVLDLGDPQKFLKQAVDPPDPRQIDRALEVLSSIDALESMTEASKEAQLTALGYHLAALPVEPRVGKLLLVGAILGVPGQSITLAAVMTSTRSVFVSPLECREQANLARRSLAVSHSDHLTAVAAYDHWKTLKGREQRAWARENFCSMHTLQAVDQARSQFADQLIAIGFLSNKKAALAESARLLPDRMHSQDYDNSLKSAALLKAILVAGLYPNVLLAPQSVVPAHTPTTSLVQIKKSLGEIALDRCDRIVANQNEVRDKFDDSVAYLHPSCIDHASTQLDHRCLVFRELVRTSKIYIRDCTTVSPLALLLFGGNLTVHHEIGVVSIDGRVHFRAESAKIATLVKVVRQELETIMLNKIQNPDQPELDREKSTTAVIRAILGADGIQHHQRTSSSKRKDKASTRQHHPQRRTDKRRQTQASAPDEIQSPKYHHSPTPPFVSVHHKPQHPPQYQHFAYQSQVHSEQAPQPPGMVPIQTEQASFHSERKSGRGRRGGGRGRGKNRASS